MDNNNQIRRFDLTQMAQQTPPVDPVVAVKNSLYMALMSRIGETDMEEIADGIVTKAKKGDAKAVDTLLKLVGGGQQPKVVERVVTVEKPVEVEKPVMIASLGEEQLRKLAAYKLLADGQCSRPALEATVGLKGADLEALLKHPWFKASAKGYELTPMGRQAVG